ncbi:hypothetical protein PVL29_016150 [Vitis rotundifolia]|uniref:Disease resistance RPP13-like protein 1 n=1 Tax=Vitis rotundifolia TaxID=103349 RepID=A0AA38ZEV7_VITRO|nr:hypothetical protein PVL29_016150 [Vitis rotundifolia]
MADALVGGAFLSASLQILFDRLASPGAMKIVRGQKLSDELLNKLKRKLLIVHAVLNDAEVKQFSDGRVKEWLEQVKDAMEPADSQTGVTATGVWDGISAWLNLPFRNQSMGARVKEMIAKLEDIAEEKDKLGMKEGVGKKLLTRSSSTSLVDESCVYGRDEIKEMVKRLLSDNTSRNKMDVISIVGMGGSGKTTLAQLLYNDERIKEHFDLKAWVCVSEEFLVLRITKLILEGIGSATPSDIQSNNLDFLQLKLKENDVWDEGCTEWDQLRTPLVAAGQGSKVVVTTRSEGVATAMRAVGTYPFGELSPQDYGDCSAYPHLEPVGKKIVDKCRGLPSAVKALGSLLYSKVLTREWNEILKSEIWDMPTAILPSLRLSYEHLPLHLKRGALLIVLFFPRTMNSTKTG